MTEEEQFAAAVALVADKGDALMRSDLAQIDLTLSKLPLDRGWMLYEAIALIVNDPEYQGDIPPMD